MKKDTKVLMALILFGTSLNLAYTASIAKENVDYVVFFILAILFLTWFNKEIK